MFKAKLKHIKKSLFEQKINLNRAVPNQKWLETPHRFELGQDFYREDMETKQGII